MATTKSAAAAAAATGSGSDTEPPQDGYPIPTTYTSRPVDVPADFLTTDPEDAQPITSKLIDWSQTDLPGNDGAYAVVLDNVLSPSECDELLRLAEESVDNRGRSGKRTWRPALVNVGGGREALHRDYRNSDRIIWDCQVVVDRLWERCARSPGLREKLAEVVVEPSERVRRRFGVTSGTRWVFSRFNDRMRFLKYQGGQFFRPHCDGPYGEEKDGKSYRTYYTVHLYLNDSVAEVGEGADLVGGATSFLSYDEEHRVDVNPKAGRVLIFQHKGLYHSGDDVVRGTKYTMRTDIMYEMQKTE